MYVTFSAGGVVNFCAVDTKRTSPSGKSGVVLGGTVGPAGRRAHEVLAALRRPLRDSVLLPQGSQTVTVTLVADQLKVEADTNS